MLKDDHKYRDLEFFQVLSGGICCLHRPSKGGILALGQNKCTVVVSLLSPSENPHEIGNACKSVGIKWLWVPLQGANKKLLEKNNTAWLLRKVLIEGKDLILKGNFMLVHCAAGIHRTGLFTYALLRILGMDKEKTLESIQKIRNVTYEKCGIHRFELGESLAQQILSESISRQIDELQQLNSVQYISNPLIWVKLSMTHMQTIRFECVVTDKNINEYVLGPNLNISIDYEYLNRMVGEDWKEFKEVKYLTGGITKHFKAVEKDLEEFFREVLPVGMGVVIGKFAFIDVRFIRALWPSLEKFLAKEMVDTSFFDEICEGDRNFESVYQEILWVKEFKDRIMR